MPLILIKINGAPRQARTAALLIKSQLLYQLSYERIFGSFCFRKVFQPKLIANLNCVHQFSSDLLLVLGAADGARSRNNQIGNLRLYQLSYCRIKKAALRGPFSPSDYPRYWFWFCLSLALPPIAYS